METTAQSPKAPKSRRRYFIAAGIAAALIITALVVLGGSDDAELVGDLPTAVATRGEMTISLTESGEIRAADMTNISNDLRWQTVILERVDEGQIVKEGDLIIRLECKELLDEIDETELELISFENDHIQAQEDIELTRKDLANKIAQAEGKVETCQNDLNKFLKHERQQELQTAESELKLAQQDLEIAQGALDFKLAVNATEGLEGSYSTSSIEVDQLDVDRNRLKVANAQAEVEKLRDYDHPNKERQLRLALDEAELELERAKLEAQARQRQVEVNEQSKRHRLEQRRRRLDELKEQREGLEVHATSPGVIIYDSGNRWDPQDMSVGATVRPRRRLMSIPNMDTLKVYSRVYEGVSEQVNVGTPAIIRLDSRDGLVLTGQVDKVSPVASSENHWLNPNLKVFPIEITLDKTPEDLKPGSSTQVELILDKAEDVLRLNIAAVFTEQDQTYVWKMIDGKAHRTTVVVGRSNATEVEIIEGLDDGDLVLLTTPPGSMLAEKPSAEGVDNPLESLTGSGSDDE